ncbi:MAG: hypothetical protein JXX28_04885 [Deltaproteobacteria bacterium]|nr:hypothetical protein [Deltaproteobacteria bacterium]
MSQERWDVVLKVLDGPMAGQGEQVLRGPVVRVGSNPGPGGLAISTGYRGLDVRHCVITAYDGTSVQVAPMGTNPVRLAPHPHVRWKEIDPISSPQYLNDGGAMHLGPVGRGVTIQFVQARRLGVWTQGALGSEADKVEAVDLSAVPKAIQVSPERTRVRMLSASAVPVWFVGCFFLMATSTAVLIAALVLIQGRMIKPLGPKDDGEDAYAFVTLNAGKPVNPQLLEGVKQPFLDFVATPNADAAGEMRLTRDENWDQRFFDYTTASVDQHLSAWNVFKRLESIRKEYGYVVQQMRSENLPEVFAAIPYIESRYTSDAQSVVCARGYWQFMPELAFRLSSQGMDFHVKNCSFIGADDLKWSPSLMAPPRVKDREYLDFEGKCRIRNCRVDDREDLEKSTEAAMAALKEAWDDQELRRSGAVTEITILSHNAGYDDSRFGYNRKTNLLPAFKRWSKGVEDEDRHRFYGENILCPTNHEENLCGSTIPAETQHYAYPIVAVHLLAVCYYGASYGDEPAFKSWAHYARDKGYCVDLNIPTAAEVRKRNK